jgi:LuxR family maltose regulon positive regulatory protein
VQASAATAGESIPPSGRSARADAGGGTAPSDTVEAGTRFAASKFLAPPLPRSHVDRPALRRRLDRAAPGAIRLVVGAPGSGKTTLLASWCQGVGAPVAWLNADRGDTDPVRFWQAAIRAVQHAVPGFAEEAFDQLTLDRSVEPDALEVLLAAAEDLRQEVTLVVDDFHLVAPAVHDHLQLLATRGTGALHLALGSRTEPRIGLARLRLLDLVCEVRDQDLRFDADDAAALVGHLSPAAPIDAVQALLERTEGWAAGMHLAAVALETSEEPDAFLDRLAGTSQLIAQYLTAELLDNQPLEVRQFLLDTAIVDHLTPELAGELCPGSPVTLFDIEAANLLVARLDRDGTVFRYHSLFADMLRYGARARDLERVRSLHRRAADWYDAAGDLTAAFAHRWRSGDPGAAIELIHGRVLSEFYAGRVPAVSQAGGSLSNADLQSAPGASVSFATALCLEGDVDGADRMLDRLDAVAAGRLDRPDRVQALTTRAAIAASRCDTAATFAAATAAVEAAESSGLANEWTTAAQSLVVRCHAWCDAFAEGEAAAARLPGGEAPVQAFEATSAIALLRLHEGRLTDAARLAESALAAMPESSRTDPSVCAPAQAVLGCVLLDRGQIAQAEPLLRATSDLPTRLRSPMIVLARMGLARVWAAAGNFDAAHQILASASTLIPSPPITSGPAVHVQVATGRLALRFGDLEGAARIVDQLPAGPARTVLGARVQIATGHPLDALDALDALVATGSPASPRQRLDVAITRLEAACALDDHERAATSAREVLDLAEPEGFVFPIAEAGGAVLDAVVRDARRRHQSPYRAQLLTVRPHAVPRALPTVEIAVDALSERERAVLRYLVTAMSYREIADDLFISVNTVKTHVKNIIRKLHARDRADAIDRARALHYL